MPKLVSDACAVAAEAAAGRTLTRKEIESLAAQLKRRAKTRKADEKLTVMDRDVLKAAADDQANEELTAAKIEKRNRMLNIIARRRLVEYIGRFGNADEGLEAFMGGVNAPVEGGRLSIDSQSKALQLEYMGGLLAALRRASHGETDLVATFNSGALDRDIARELWALSKGDPPVTDSGPARTIAEAIDQMQERARKRSNMAGTWVHRSPNYIVRQSHHTGRIRRASFEQWRDFILPLLDGPETFKGVTPTSSCGRPITTSLPGGTSPASVRAARG